MNRWIYYVEPYSFMLCLNYILVGSIEMVDSYALMQSF